MLLGAVDRAERVGPRIGRGELNLAAQDGQVSMKCIVAREGHIARAGFLDATRRVVIAQVTGDEQRLCAVARDLQIIQQKHFVGYQKIKMKGSTAGSRVDANLRPVAGQVLHEDQAVVLNLPKLQEEPVKLPVNRISFNMNSCLVIRVRLLLLA